LARAQREAAWRHRARGLEVGKAVRGQGSHQAEWGARRSCGLLHAHDVIVVIELAPLTDDDAARGQAG
jgi:hypothetical protein